jgi:hypothetical protein
MKMDAITEVDDQSDLKDAFIRGAEVLLPQSGLQNVRLKQKLTATERHAICPLERHSIFQMKRRGIRFGVPLVENQSLQS